MKARFINEELIGSYEGSFGFGNIEIWKNPPSISRMGSWARAFTDQNGDFYIASVEGEERDTIATTHIDMIDWLNDEGNYVKIV